MKRLEIQFYNELTNESISLPVNPEKIEISKSKASNQYNILGFGEINIMGDKNLYRVSISNFFPDSESILSTLSSILTNGVIGQFDKITASEIVNRWIDENAIIRVIVSDEFNELMQITNFTKSINENTGDIDYTLDFIEYVDPKKEVKPLPKTTAALKERKRNLRIPKTYLCKINDTLYKLAVKYYGDGEQWVKLAKINNINNANLDLMGKNIRLLPYENIN